MSFKSGCYISGEVVMTKIQWVQCLIQGCDAMREVDDIINSVVWCDRVDVKSYVLHMVS